MKSKDKGIKSISLENFRVFKDKCDFELAPITILTGANSSGKSSIIKAMKLMQSYCKDGIANFDELGGFENTINNKSSEKEIVITHRIQKEGYSYFFGTFLVEYVFVKSEDLKGELKYVSVYIENEANPILIYRKNQDEESSFDEDYIMNVYIPKFQSLKEDLKEYNVIVNKDIRIAQKGFYEHHEGFFDGEENIPSYDSYIPDLLEPPVINKEYCLTRNIDYQKVKAFESLNMLFNGIGENTLVKFCLNNPYLSEIQRIILYLSVEQINYYYENMYFIDALRSGAQREYGLKSNESDFEKLASECITEKWLEDKIIKDEMLKWINDFEIAEDIDFEPTDEEKFQIIVTKNGKRMNIKDLGFGVFHLIHLFLNLSKAIYYREKDAKEKNRVALVQGNDNEREKIMLSIFNRNKTIVIEEPESHLHPKLQSKLAELFVNNIDNANFIVETHSEYIIWKLQYLTAKGDVKPDETIIHYIGNPDAKKRSPEEEQVRTIHINSNGKRTKPFGSGFTDESSKWIKAMFGLPNSN